MSIESNGEGNKSTFIQNWFRFERNEIFLLLSFFFFGMAFANYEAYAPVWLQTLFNVDSFLLIGLVTVATTIASKIYKHDFLSFCGFL